MEIALHLSFLHKAPEQPMPAGIARVSIRFFKRAAYGLGAETVHQTQRYHMID